MTNKLLYLILLLIISCSETNNIVDKKTKEWSFVVFSDVQDGFTNYCPIAHQISNIQPIPLLAIHGGDVTYTTGVQTQWEKFWQCSAPIIQKMPMLLVRGNHEGNDSIAEQAFRSLGRNHREKFYYTHTVNNALFVILDIYIPGQEFAITGDQLEWLNNQLQNATADPYLNYIFIFMHLSPFPQGWHAPNPLYDAENFHSLLIKHKKVKAVFSGHEHFFNRFVKDGLNYITTGGAGGDLYRSYGGDYYHFTKVSIQYPQISIQTISPEGDVMDEFEI